VPQFVIELLQVRKILVGSKEPVNERNRFPFSFNL
jgi:hypothetical protein